MGLNWLPACATASDWWLDGRPLLQKCKSCETIFSTTSITLKRTPAKLAPFLSQGESPPDASLNPRELAAYAAVASMLLNLDETVTKQ